MPKIIYLPNELISLDFSRYQKSRKRRKVPFFVSKNKHSLYENIPLTLICEGNDLYHQMEAV